VTNDLKLKIYPAVIAILGLGLVALLLSRVEIQVANQPALDRSLDRPLDRSARSTDSPANQPLDRSPDSPARSPSAPAASPAVPMPSAPPPAAMAGSQGGLRVSNQTAYPVRVALLYHQLTAQPKPEQPKPEQPKPEQPKPEQPKFEQPKFEQPVHWDFAPGEGGSKGLIMSLPTGGLRLSGGDVLVAFAQDGSRRYWGPYVVGKTALPVWSSQQKEWVLPLQP
jgi:hypothetical protein